MAPAADEPEHGVRSDLHFDADSHGELLCRIAERDHEAFEILYRRYVRPVYGLALRRLHDRERAEDATQLAFAAIWRSAATYVPECGAGERWLFTVARNAIVDQELPGVTPREPGPESTAEDGWLAFRVHAAVGELPEQERVPLELVYWGGRSQSEIAELLGLPLGIVETRTRSALERLAARLEGLR
jgi:RNA polymerase sigma-70 factor, ECF subfamily